MADDENQVDETAEESHEVEEETTEEASDETEEPEEDLEQIRKDAKAFKDQKIRAEKAESELKKFKGGKKETGNAPNKNGQALSEEDTARINRSEDRSERAALRSMGITHPDDIQYVRDAAKRLGEDVEQAAEDEFVKSKLERMQEARKTKESTPGPSKRGGSARNTKLPDFSKMSNTEFDKWEKANRR
jgi:hypothetical protein